MAIASFSRATGVLLLALLATGAAHAVYRCGKVYQDRPCDDNSSQVLLTPGIRPKPAGAVPPASPFTASCARIGQEAQKMVWKREGGATQEKQLAELPDTGSREEMARVLDSVYRKRGSAPEIKAAVEAECVAEKQLAADTAATIRALQSQQQGAAPPVATASSSAAPPAADASTAAGTRKTSIRNDPSLSCSDWRSALESVNAALRRGGNAATMEKLQDRRRDVEKSLREGRC